MSGSLVFVLLVISVVLYFIYIFNKLVTLKNRFKNAFAQIDVQLKRRYDLIPNMVETAKGYMQHENQTLVAVTEARGLAQSANSKAKQNPGSDNALQGLSKAEGLLSGALANFLAVAENYPELKADKHMQELLEELTNTENRIAFSRQHYNDSVMHYNTYAEQFPNSLVASGRFKPAPLLEIEGTQHNQAVNVSFS